MNRQSKIISKVLSPALQLWLRSQVDQVESLRIEIAGGDRQILGGYIPSVSLSSSHAVYQGLHLREVQIKGENIRINLGQVLKGKPLHLLEPIQVKGEVRLEEADLKASLSSSLLSNALTDLLLILLKVKGVINPKQILEEYQISWQEITLNLDQFTIVGTIIDREEYLSTLVISSRLQLSNPQQLSLHSIQIEALPDFLNFNLDELPINLGTDVELEQLNLQAGKLFCCGGLIIRGTDF